MRIVECECCVPVIELFSKWCIYYPSTHNQLHTHTLRCPRNIFDFDLWAPINRVFMCNCQRENKSFIIWTGFDFFFCSSLFFFFSVYVFSLHFVIISFYFIPIFRFGCSLVHDHTINWNEAENRKRYFHPFHTFTWFFVHYSRVLTIWNQTKYILSLGALIHYTSFLMLKRSFSFAPFTWNRLTFFNCTLYMV